MTVPDDGKWRSERGFRVFCDTRDRAGMQVSVVESSLAFEGPHCRIYVGRAFENAHLDLPGARRVRDALSVFITEATAGELTERPTEENK